MFSTKYYDEIRTEFKRRMELPEKCAYGNIRSVKQKMLCDGTDNFLGEKKKEIQDVIADCTEEERQALTFLYSAMPVSDMLDYSVSLFLDYAKHGVYLWQNGPFAGRIPEHIFADYVLHYRINNEDITETRRFFHDRIQETGYVRTDSLYNAAVDINYWCAGEATYRSTDNRTQNPRTMYNAAIGRCGEESTLTVTALRSMGIPARQVYAPLWSHCDDNHAWVEIWCDGHWYFLGACEPEMQLNTGWFLEASSRAMMVHSRWFDIHEPEEEQVGKKGTIKVLNHLSRYARTLTLSVKTVDEEGNLLPGTRVEFQVLNQGTFGTIAEVWTGYEPENYGIARLVTGYGDLQVSAGICRESDRGKEWLYGEKLIPLHCIKDKQDAEFVVVMKSFPECTKGWMEFVFHAPQAEYKNFSRDKEDIKKDLSFENVKPECSDCQECKWVRSKTDLGKQRLDRMTLHRNQKEKGFYSEAKTSEVLLLFGDQNRMQAEEILRSARGNMREIVRFLEWDAESYLPPVWKRGDRHEWKLKVLNTLREKDYWDIDADILKDCCINAFPYAENLPEDIFFPFLLSPRVSDEMLRPCRTMLSLYLSKDAEEEIRKCPSILWKAVDEEIQSLPEEQYEDLITSSLNCLKGGIGSRHSKKVLCVNLYRSLGIPARLNLFDGTVEYYDGEDFTSAEYLADNRKCRLILCEDDSMEHRPKLFDWEHYSLERFEEGSFLCLWPHQISDRIQGRELELILRPGIYRILTSDRRKNGDQIVKKIVFSMNEGESRIETLSFGKLPEEDGAAKIQVKDFLLKTLKGKVRKLSELLEKDSILFLWIETGREPTEHILNELYDKRREFAKLKNSIYVILKTSEDLNNATLQRTIKVLPALNLFIDDSDKNAEVMAEEVGEEKGSLPLALVLNHEKKCLYSSAGYNVGLADTLLKILMNLNS